LRNEEDNGKTGKNDAEVREKGEEYKKVREAYKRYWEN